METFWENMLANAILGVAYLAYKIVDRCAQSKCKYSTDKGLVFDLDNGEPCPVTDLNKISDMLKRRASQYKLKAPPPLPPIPMRV